LRKKRVRDCEAAPAASQSLAYDSIAPQSLRYLVAEGGSKGVLKECVIEVDNLIDDWRWHDHSFPREGIVAHVLSEKAVTIKSHDTGTRIMSVIAEFSAKYTLYHVRGIGKLPIDRP
jgi:hypothetical protein